ncbi:MAG: CocE/NonD family hydrolase [Verrucomicrobiota bacterium]
MIKSVFRWFLLGAVVGQVLSAEIPRPVTTNTVMVSMRDGVKLATDIYLPPGVSPWPVVLMRTPYNKTGMATPGQSATRLGYAIVIQDTRGRFGSEGENLPFPRDAEDGFDTVAWIQQQGWCNGKIGTFGGSALAITQLQLAGTGADLACQHLAVGGPSLFGDVVYTGGVFRKALVEDWLRLNQFSPRGLELWTGHSFYDAYWAARDVSRHYRHVNVPAVHIGGYYDIFAQATIDAFNGYQLKAGPRARGHQKLLMGPWTHGVLTDKAGDLTFPNSSRPPNNVHDQIRWWEYYLKGVNNGVAQLPAVTYYVMGDVKETNAPGNVWRTAEQWPPVPTREMRWYLHGDLTFSPQKAKEDQTVAYLYDPKQPAPTFGGYQLSIPAGPRDQRPVEERPDVLVFSSEPLPEPLEVTGQVRAKLFVSSDAPDTDFLVRLCDVYPDGASYNICEGIIRARYRHSFLREDLLKPGKVYPLEIDLWSTSMVFNRGHRLRVHITSSSAPGYDPNPNTGEPLRWSERTAVASNAIHLSSRCPSYLELPVSLERWSH